MKFAILAAGEGSRLAQEGAVVPKPLTKLNGEKMIDRLIRIFCKNGAEEIVVIVNELTDLVKQHLESNYVVVGKDCDNIKTAPLVPTPIRIVVKTTPSSMHSFYELSKFLCDDKFCLTTVDTVFREDEFTEYINALNNTEADGLLAVTSFVDDEKPLYVAVDNNFKITGFHDQNQGDKYVSGGIYSLRPSAIKTLNSCMEKGISRMRNFQRQMVEDGLDLRAYPFAKIIDVDHVDDIKKAEQLLG